MTDLGACTCAACQALAERYRTDPVLLRFYPKKLLVRGWGGQTDPVEKAYILAHGGWAQSALKAGQNTRLHVSTGGDEQGPRGGGGRGRP